MRTYEGLFVFEDSMRDEALDGVLDRVRGDITRFEGKVLATIPLGRKTFARPMKKRETGQYFRIVFELGPDRMAALRARYRINEDILRVQITLGDKLTADLVRPADEERSNGESE